MDGIYSMGYKNPMYIYICIIYIYKYTYIYIRHANSFRTPHAHAVTYTHILPGPITTISCSTTYYRTNIMMMISRSIN